MADRRDDRRFPHLFEWILPAKIQDLCDICMIYRARSAIVAALSAYLQAEASKNRPISRQKSPISSTKFPVFSLSLGRFRRTFPRCSQRKRKLWPKSFRLFPRPCEIVGSPRRFFRKICGRAVCNTWSVKTPIAGLSTRSSSCLAAVWRHSLCTRDV